ncbi:hypothetical protein [Metabacillus idriensis]|uniref:hypothetical protein n=1 Tax=Metabacillus idriensis TaxID=324768 RepID=UPI0017496883|nr:hypothetical protein [Metabacillus idriensis]
MFNFEKIPYYLRRRNISETKYFYELAGFTTNIYLAVIGFLFRQALMNAGNPIQMLLMMNKVPDEMKGIANSLSQMPFHSDGLRWVRFNLYCCIVWVVLGLKSFIFTITGFIYLAGALYFLLVFREKKRDYKKSTAV